MSPKVSDVGFRIFTTNDFLFGLLSQFLLLILERGVVAQEMSFATIRCQAPFLGCPHFNEDIHNPIQRCSACAKMSNKIALVSLDIAGTGSMCGDNKGVTTNGPATN